MPEPGAATAAPRFVLDTNVCLDLFVFDDPRCADLRAAVESGRITLVTRDDCRAEWRKVLGYPILKLDDAAQARADARFARWVIDVPLRALDDIALPRCKDRDDQKFLELAYQAGAIALLSRDDEVLKLARRAQREGLFAILPPQQWQRALPTSES